MRALKKNIINLYGAKGKKWLADLPKLVMEMEVEHGLSDLKPVHNMSYSYVLSGFQGSQPIILKLGPDIAGLKQEGRALKAFAGFGAAKLLAEKDGMLLLDRAIPGIPLKSYFPAKDDAAIQITCHCLKRLHKARIPPNSTFPHVKDWLAALDKNWQIPVKYLQKARQLRDRLLLTSAKEVLLHGDLHHDNMLQNGNSWIVIDPKGVIGEPAYEVAAFIRNPISELNITSDIISHRISRFSKILKLPAQRILDWCFVQAILAWIWTLEDGGNTGYFKKLTAFFDKHSL